jgi:hypothetical protein
MPLRLTLSLIAAVCERIKAGAFEQVAVESLGISYVKFQDWLRRGQRRRAGRLCRQLAAEVPQARAHARFMAEMRLREEDTKAWLLNGPGRQTADRDGWGSASAADRGREAADKAQYREWLLDVGAMLLEALTPFPEARAAVVEVLARCLPPDT